jgi:hypothetical protein
MPRRGYAPAGSRLRERRPTSRPHAGFWPSDVRLRNRSSTRSPSTGRRRYHGGSCRRGLIAAPTRRVHPDGTRRGVPRLRDPACRALERDALGRCSTVAIQWKRRRRRGRPTANAPGSAATARCTLTCLMRAPPARSRSVSSPARGGKTTGEAAGKPWSGGRADPAARDQSYRAERCNHRDREPGRQHQRQRAQCQQDDDHGRNRESALDEAQIIGRDDATCPLRRERGIPRSSLKN